MVAPGSRRASICSHAEWESTAWMRRTRPTRSRTLRLWTCPMKSQVKRSPNSACLAASASVRFSPTSAMPASWSAGSSAGSTYLVAARISTPGPTCSRIRARLAETTAASTMQHPDHSLAARHAVVAPVREVAIRRADGALARNDDVPRTGRLERPPRAQPQIGVPGRARRRRQSGPAAARPRRRRPRSSTARRPARRRPQPRRRRPPHPARRCRPPGRASPRASPPGGRRRHGRPRPGCSRRSAASAAASPAR